jgi:hypothetical protein
MLEFERVTGSQLRVTRSDGVISPGRKSTSQVSMQTVHRFRQAFGRVG